MLETFSKVKVNQLVETVYAIHVGLKVKFEVI